MPLTPIDYELLRTIARYYVLTRPQIQQLCFADHNSGRATRKRLTKLRHAGYITKHKMPVLLPAMQSAAPAYYLTKQGTEALAAYYDDDAWLATNTKHPRADRLAHWISIANVRIEIEQALSLQSYVKMLKWYTEWETINKESHSDQQFTLHVQFSQSPRLSCSPDAAMLLSVAGVSKVFYLEVDLGTSSPHQIAARKTKGYEELGVQQYHRIHFPETTLDDFSVLMITTNGYRCRATAKAVSRCPGAERWLFVDRREITPESFLHGPIVLDCQSHTGPLVKTPDLGE